MRCEHVRAWMEDALGGAASPMELARALPHDAQVHLDACAACRADVHEALALARALGPSLEEAGPPAALLAGVMSRVRESPPGDAPLALAPVLDADFAEALAPPPSNRPLLAAAVLLFAGCVAFAAWGEPAWGDGLASLRGSLSVLTGWLDVDPWVLFAAPASAISAGAALAAALLVLLAASALSWRLSADGKAVAA